MSESKVVQKLDELTELRELRMVLAARSAKIQLDALALAGTKDAWRELLREQEAAADQAKALEAEIKSGVIEVGKSVRGAELLATWNKPRVTWDGKGLDGFAVAHPEIKAFRKEGKPSCSIRKAPKSKAEPPSAPPEVTAPPMTDLSDASVKGAGFRLKVARFVAGGA